MSQDIFKKAPAGYRFATDEEQREVLDGGMALQMWSSKCAQHNAEVKAAQLELQRALSNLQVAQENNRRMMARLGLDGKPGDIHSLGTKMVILVDKKKRVEQVEDLLPKKKLAIPELPKAHAPAQTRNGDLAMPAPASAPAHTEKKSKGKRPTG